MTHSEPPDPSAPTHPHGFDATLRGALRGVLASALVLTLLGAMASGPRAALGIGVGGGIAYANLYLFARIVHGMVGTARSRAAWTVVLVLKLLALFGVVWLLLRSGEVPGLALAVGYAALPVGVVVGSLLLAGRNGGMGSPRRS